MRKRLALSLLTVLLLVPLLRAQKNLSGTAEIEKGLDRLNTLGSIMMIAAHPDDENTALIAYFAKGRNMRTAYLSLTRGEGGQNLIGAEQGDKIGVIRTQELLAARRIDGGEQYFARAVDFGFSKTAAETIGKWGREQVLADIVWNIRRFQPDVIVLRFSGTPHDGHGHHQTSAILGKEAFSLAGDASKFPDQLKYLKPWQPKRLFFNLFAFLPQQEAENEKVANTIPMDYGLFDPILGYSYTEIAGQSRSQHRSQGMGAPERRGAARNHLQLLAGDPAAKDPFEGIDTTWNRVEGGAAIGKLTAKARDEFNPRHPEKLLPVLLEARSLIAKNQDAWSVRKLPELDELIALCAGLWVDVTTDRAELVPGQPVKITTSAISRQGVPVTIQGKALEPNRLASFDEETTVPKDRPLSQPYWLRQPKDGANYRIPDQTLLGLPENPPETRRIVANIAGTEIALVRPVHYRYVDRVEGELVRPIAVVPPVAVELSEKVYLFTGPAARQVEVTITPKAPGQSGSVGLVVPDGWKVEPAKLSFSELEPNSKTTLRFSVTPPSSAGRGQLRAVVYQDGESSTGIDVIRYPHIPPQTLLPDATAELVLADVKILSKNIGYIMGAGDDVPDSLRQLGCAVTLLSGEDLAHADLSRFDAIVAGVRAYNTRPDVRANHHRLMRYVEQGGTMLVQYNVAPNRFFSPGESLGALGPYPFKLSNGRVTDEDAAVETISDSNLLKKPNAIVADDWKGWVQERGLYFTTEWDPKYQPLFRIADPGEKAQDGSTLVTKYGKGVYIYTSLAWFRQLPAGVPGAYRIFANLLSAGKAQ